MAQTHLTAPSPVASWDLALLRSCSQELKLGKEPRHCVTRSVSTAGQSARPSQLPFKGTDMGLLHIGHNRVPSMTHHSQNSPRPHPAASVPATVWLGRGQQPGAGSAKPRIQDRSVESAACYAGSGQFLGLPTAPRGHLHSGPQPHAGAMQP